MFTVTRSTKNPLISASKERPWEASAAFNWSPVRDGKSIHVAYRAVSDIELLREPRIRTSIIARATSKDGETFSDRAPFVSPREEWEKFGCEDPRVTKLGSTYYTFYTALSTYPFSADGIKVAVALSKDMKTATERHLVTPFNAKAMTLFPEKINGKFGALLTVNSDLPPSTIAYAEFDKVEDMWSPEFWHSWKGNLESHALNLRRGNGDHVEIGAAPLKTDHGWLLVYSHINHYTTGTPVFGIEAALLDLKNPRKVIGRTKGPFMVPEEYYELTGFVPNIVFPSGALIEGDRLDVYYGGADTHCAKASIPLQSLLKAIVPDSKKLFTRFPGNPIISPREGKDWEAGGTLNPAAIDIKGKVHLLYRAATKDNVSTFGYAASKDGFIIDERSDGPIYSARTDFEGKGRDKGAGCEDPRIVEIEGRLYMTYTAYDGTTPRVSVTSIAKEDFIKRRWNAWTIPEAISGPGIPNKDACIIPEKIRGEYFVFHRVETSICGDTFASLDFSQVKINRCIALLSPRKGMWDGKKVGLAGPPIKTTQGWLAFYHGISETGTYRVGAALLGLKEPSIVLARTAAPIFEPQASYELEGVVSRVVFPCGTIVRKGVVYLYYGAADKVICVATAKLSAILDTLSS